MPGKVINPQLKSRIIVGFAVAAIIAALACISFIPTYGPKVASFIAILIFAFVTLEASELLIDKFIFKVISISALLATFVFGIAYCPEFGILFALIITILASIIYSTFSESTEQPLKSFQFLSTLFLIVAGGSSATYLLLSPSGNIWLLIAVLTTAISDSIAYFAGNKFSGPKLAPKISPNKTWSGAIAALMVGTLFSAFLLTGFIGLPYFACFVVSLFIVSTGILTDLAQSRIKRISNVKDSGTILGGHGGLFDRVDSHIGALIVAVIGKLLLT